MSAAWMPILEGLPGLSKEEKRRAKLIILDKDKEDRPLYFTGDSEDVTRNMIDLLRLADGGERMSAAVLLCCLHGVHGMHSVGGAVHGLHKCNAAFVAYRHRY